MKILFVTNNMPFGGVERALLDNVSVLLSLGHQVHILLREKDGAMLDEIPKSVLVYELPLLRLDRYELNYGRVPTLRYTLLHGHWLFAARMIFMRLIWIINRRSYNYDYEVVRSAVSRVPRQLYEVYDVAIAYAGDFPWSVIMTLDWVRAKKKITWCHNERCYNRFSKQLFSDYYSRFDAHYACSEATAARINKALGRVGVVKGFPHLVHTHEILHKADEPLQDSRFTGALKILTVGRLTDQKAPDIAVQLCARLVRSGIRISWFWIGDGPVEIKQKILEQIDNLGVSNSFILLGAQKNPYPYIKGCDIYVQPSRYEGYCLTVAEARIFNKPIVLTDFDGAREQIQDRKTGLIVAEGDEGGLFNAIQRVCLDEQSRERLSEALAQEQPDTLNRVVRAWKELLDEHM